MGKILKKFLQKNIVDKGIQEELSVIDSKLGAAIKDKLEIGIAMSEQTKELQRCLRLNIQDLLSDITEEQQKQMEVGSFCGLFPAGPLEVPLLFLWLCGFFRNMYRCTLMFSGPLTFGLFWSRLVRRGIFFLLVWSRGFVLVWLCSRGFVLVW